MANTYIHTLAGSNNSECIETFSAINISASQTTVQGSEAGNVVFSQPFIGATYKKIMIYCNSLQGTATYIFPNSFINIPIVLNTSGLSMVLITDLSTYSLTVTGSNSTGFLIVEGY